MTYAVGSVSQTALAFLLLPLYLRRLTPSEYGILSVLLTVNSVISLAAGAGILSGLSRLYYEQTAETRRALAGTVVTWMAGTGLLVAVLMAWAATPFSALLFGAPEYATLVRLTAAVLLISALQGAMYILLRLEKRASAFVAISILGFSLDLLLKIYWIGFERRGVEGYLVSSSLSTALTVCAAAWVLRRNVAWTWQSTLLRDLLALGLPFVFTGFGMWALDISDRLILNAFAGPGPVGVYTLAYKFASIFNIVLLGPVSLFWTPFIFSYSVERGEEAMRRISGQALSAFVLIGSLLVIGVGIGAADVIRLFTSDPNYQMASTVVPFLTLAPFLYLLSYPAGSAILQSKQVRYSSYSVVAAAGVNVLLNLILVPTFSLYGATAATVIGYLVLWGSQYFWAQRVFAVSYDWSRAVKVVVSGVIATSVALQFHLDAVLFSFLLREATGVLVFGGVAWLLGAVSKADIRFIQELVSHRDVQPQVLPSAQEV